MKLIHFLSLLLFLSGNLFGADLYRILYSSDPIRDHGFHSRRVQKQLKQGGRQRKLLKQPSTVRKFDEETDPYITDAYGSKVYVLPEEGKKPESPRSVAGTVIPTDVTYDYDWVKSKGAQGNPGLAMKDVSVPLSEKWAEYEFVSKYAPKMAPPPMKLGSTFVHSVISEEDRKNRRPENFDKLSKKEKALLIARIEEALQRVKPEDFTEYCKKIKEDLGDSFIKLRYGFHSEGNVPKSYKDLAAIWKGYLSETRPKIKEKVEEDGDHPLGVSNAQLMVQNDIWDWEFIEGSVLEEWVLDPEMIVVQKKIKLAKEVRLHIVEHVVLKGATFLRMYEPLGQFLTSDEMGRWEREVKENFLANLKGKYQPFSASPDVVLDADTGTLRILDLNPGFESGYLFPDEDIITTHTFAAYYTGEKTPLLKRLEEYRDAPFSAKGELLKGIRQDYKDFVYGDAKNGYDHQSFWDRIIRDAVDNSLESQRTGVRFDAILSQFDEAKLQSLSIWYQFINEVQTRTRVRLSEDRMKYWVKRLKAIEADFDPGYNVEAVAGKLVVSAKD